MTGVSGRESESGAKARQRGPHKIRDRDVRVPGTLSRAQRRGSQWSRDVRAGTEAGRAERGDSKEREGTARKARALGRG